MSRRSVFLGPHGLRAGWRYAIFYVVTNAITAIPFLILYAFGIRKPTTLTAPLILGGELIQLAGLLAAVLIMARIERRRFSAYGLTRRGAFGVLFWQGMLWGIASVAALVGMIALDRGYTLGSLALHGEALVKSVAVWALATLAIGVVEELEYRGYSLFTFASGMGFWPGALLISALFAAQHYFGKPDETWMDALSVGLIGLFFCLTVRRTGSLWFAIGWHGAFNFGQFCLFGSPNSANQGRPFEGHLFASAFHGPEWLTGGKLGIEASAFVIPVIVASFALFPAIYRQTRWPDFTTATPAKILEFPAEPSRGA